MSEICFLLITGWVRESGKLSVLVFGKVMSIFGRCRNIFRANVAQPPPRKIGPYVCGPTSLHPLLLENRRLRCTN